MYALAVVDPAMASLILSRVSAILKNKYLYRIVESQTNVPWDVISCLHSLETDLSLDKHLHNGDPLTARTINVPKGRPKSSKPPFAWVESACDAVGIYPNIPNWDIPSKLYFLEAYNGLGYRKMKVNSPYLWSMTSLYKKGKYTQDGKFSGSAVSKQIGAVALLKGLTKAI